VNHSLSANELKYIFKEEVKICIAFPVAGPVEADPEYQLIVEANNITVEIDNEISKYIGIPFLARMLLCTSK